ncbi:GvpL/GvpF family gas vesicle protein [Nocardioides mesophilus]|uniref:GvpL/GvpF family gas vesicle protein n=1 Tax=Nocardioides mesophilus TaxID=433659 RepID=A0A7G9R7G6_9ACTN|nr:GvpL/GvpF family gas vesicle protein [Nocardioides mesophilus]QNN51541.1 GvpL/GvpF family gas vesicle protein [Nocardioides mesophilus]
MPVHLYGVVAAGPSPPQGLVGLEGRPVRWIGDDHLKVAAGDVEEGARVRRAHLLAHAHVLERLAAQMSVVPVRFAMVLPDDATVRSEVLEARRAHLTELLQAFDGLVQLTVHADHVEEAALREVLARHPELVELRDAARASADPAVQVRLGEQVTQALEELQREDAGSLLDRVSPHARAVAVNDRRGGLEVLDAALLVDRRVQPRLDEAVATAREELAGRLSLRYVGPQPPYSFLEAVRDGGAVWG